MPFLLVFLFFFLLSKLFFSLEFDIQNNTCIHKDVLDRLILNKSVLDVLLKKDEFENELKSQFPCLQKVNTSLEFPNKINIELINRETTLVVKLVKPNLLNLSLQEATPSSLSADIDRYLAPIIPDLTEEIFFVDKDGVVFSNQNTSEEKTHPQIYLFNQMIRLGDDFPKQYIENTLKIVDKLQEMFIEYKSIRLLERHLLIEGPIVLIFDLEKDTSRQLISLQLILQEAKINSKDNIKMKKIDLRFNKPIVTYYSPK